MTRHLALVPFALALLALMAWAGVAQDAPAVWSAEEIAVVAGFRVPESALPVGDWVFVSNIDSDPQGYWTDDGVGSIVVMSPDGELLDDPFLEGLDAPKGMCLLDDTLYVADNTRVLVVTEGELGEPICPEGAKRLNDMATDGEFVYVSDTLGGAIYRIAPDGEVTQLKAPESPNGIAFFEGRMFAVSWDLHEVYEVDPTGSEDPQPFGLAEHFTNLDGIVVLEDGTILVSDFTGGKVSAISPDQQTVTTLLELESPADIGLDSLTNRLYVPQFMVDQVAIYDLIRAGE